MKINGTYQQMNNFDDQPSRVRLFLRMYDQVQTTWKKYYEDSRISTKRYNAYNRIRDQMRILETKLFYHINLDRI